MNIVDLKFGVAALGLSSGLVLACGDGSPSILPTGGSGGDDGAGATMGSPTGTGGMVDPTTSPTTTAGASVTAGGETTGTMTTSEPNTTGPSGDDTDTGGVPSNPHRECGSAAPDIALTPVIEDLDSPIFAEFPASDPGVVFVALRGGQLQRIELANPQNRTTVLMVQVQTAGECGFLSFALHPDFGVGGENRFYVSRSPACGAGPGQVGSMVEEFTLDGDNATLSREIFSTTQRAQNHNGGHVAFGPDGFLYFSLGDEGQADDVFGNGQNVSTPHGSLLRIDIDNLGTAPAGNLTQDMVGGQQVEGLILHWGLRNPWRFSFDRATGDLYIGDVGQDNWEEVDVLAVGTGPTNFGWPAFEGNNACPGCDTNNMLVPGTTDVKPITEYVNPPGFQAQSSVTGGYVYRGSAIADMVGRYIYGDYALGFISALTWDGSSAVACDERELVNGLGSGLASFAEDSAGELYAIHINEGTIFRIDPGQ